MEASDFSVPFGEDVLLSRSVKLSACTSDRTCVPLSAAGSDERPAITPGRQLFHDSTNRSRYNVSLAQFSQVKRQLSESLILRSPRTFDAYNCVDTGRPPETRNVYSECSSIINLLLEQKVILDQQLRNICSHVALDQMFVSNIERILVARSRDAALQKGMTSSRIRQTLKREFGTHQDILSGIRETSKASNG